MSTSRPSQTVFIDFNDSFSYNGDKQSNEYAYGRIFHILKTDRGLISEQDGLIGELARSKGMTGLSTLELYKEYCQVKSLNLYVIVNQGSIVREHFVDGRLRSLILLQEGRDGRDGKDGASSLRVLRSPYQMGDKESYSPYWFVVYKNNRIHMCMRYNHNDKNAINSRGQLIRWNVNEWSSDLVYLFHRFIEKGEVKSTVYFEPDKKGVEYFQHVAPIVMEATGAEDPLKWIADTWSRVREKHPLTANIARRMGVRQETLPRLNPLRPESEEMMLKFAAAFGLSDIVEYVPFTFEWRVNNMLSNIVCFCLYIDGQLRFLRVNGERYGEIVVRNNRVVDIQHTKSDSFPPPWSLIYQTEATVRGRKPVGYPLAQSQSVILASKSPNFGERSLERSLGELSNRPNQSMGPVQQGGPITNSETQTSQVIRTLVDPVYTYVYNECQESLPGENVHSLQTGPDAFCGQPLYEYIRALLLNDLPSRIYFQRCWYGLKLGRQWKWPEVVYAKTAEGEFQWSALQFDQAVSCAVILVQHAYNESRQHVFTIRRPVNLDPDATYMVVLRAGDIYKDGVSLQPCQDYILCDLRWKLTNGQLNLIYDDIWYHDPSQFTLSSFNPAFVGERDVIHYLYDRVPVSPVHQGQARKKSPVWEDNSCFLHSSFELLKFTGHRVNKDPRVRNLLSLFSIYQAYLDTNDLSLCMDMFRTLYGLESTPFTPIAPILSPFAWYPQGLEGGSSKMRVLVANQQMDASASWNEWTVMVCDIEQAKRVTSDVWIRGTSQRDSLIRAAIRHVNGSHFTFLMKDQERDDKSERYPQELVPDQVIEIACYVAHNRAKPVDMEAEWTKTFEPRTIEVLEEKKKRKTVTIVEPEFEPASDPEPEPVQPVDPVGSVDSVGSVGRRTTRSMSRNPVPSLPSIPAPPVPQSPQMEREPENGEINEEVMNINPPPRITTTVGRPLKAKYHWETLIPLEYRKKPSYTWYEVSKNVEPLGCYSQPSLMRQVFNFNHDNKYFSRDDDGQGNTIDVYSKPRLADMLLLAFRMALANRSQYFGIENGHIIRLADGTNMMPLTNRDMCQACKKQCETGVPCGDKCAVNGICQKKPPHSVCLKEDHRDLLAYKAGGRDTVFVYKIPTSFFDTWDPQLDSLDGDGFKFPTDDRYTYKTPEATGWKCKNDSARPYPFALSKSQAFVTSYFDPLQPHKSLLLYKSAGSGKTCEMVSIMGRYFMHDYTAIWITRKAIKGEPSKAIFRDICMDHIRTSFIDDPQVKTLDFNRGTTRFSESHLQKDKMKFIQGAQDGVLKGAEPYEARENYDYKTDRAVQNNASIIRGRLKADPFYIRLTNQDIITYNDMVDALLKPDKPDDLRTRFQRALDKGAKFIIFMDEAHNLNNDDPGEFSKMNLQTSLDSYSVVLDGNEYKYSRPVLIPGAKGKLYGRDVLLAFVTALMNANRGRLVLATATPMISSVLDACVMMNFAEPNVQKRLPTDRTSWYDQKGDLYKDKVELFKGVVDSRVSYLSSTLDPTYFAQKVFHDFVVVPATAKQTQRFREAIAEYNQQIKDMLQKDEEKAKARDNVGRKAVAFLENQEPVQSPAARRGKKGRGRKRGPPNDRDEATKDRYEMTVEELTRDYQEALYVLNETEQVAQERGAALDLSDRLDDFNDTLERGDDGKYFMLTLEQYLEKFTKTQSRAFKEFWQNMYNYSIVDDLHPEYTVHDPEIQRKNLELKRLFDEATVAYNQYMTGFVGRGRQKNLTFIKWLNEHSPDRFRALLERVSKAGVLKPWDDTVSYKLTVPAGLTGTAKEDLRVERSRILHQHRQEIAPKIDVMIKRMMATPANHRHVVFSNTAGTVSSERNWGALTVAGFFKVDPGFHVFKPNELVELKGFKDRKEEMNRRARQMCNGRIGVMFMSTTSYTSSSGIKAKFEFHSDNQAFVQDLFNDPSNADFLRVIILDRKFSEGVSFFNIHWQHHLDAPFSRYALEQSTARGVRFCRSNDLPFYKGVGGFCRILFYDLSFKLQENDADHVLVKDAILSLADRKWLKEQQSIDEFDQILQVNAIDRDYNREINEYMSPPLTGQIIRVFDNGQHRLSMGSAEYPYRIYLIKTTLNTTDDRTETFEFMVDGQHVVGHPNYLTDPQYQQSVAQKANLFEVGRTVQFTLPYAVTMAQRVLNIGNYTEVIPNAVLRYKERERLVLADKILPFGLEGKPSDQWTERDQSIQKSNRFPLISQIPGALQMSHEHLLGQFKQSYSLALSGLTAIALDPMFTDFKNVRFCTTPLRWTCARYANEQRAGEDDQVVMFGNQLALFNPDTREEEKQTGEGEDEDYFKTYKTQIGTLKHRFVGGRAEDTCKLSELFRTARPQQYMIVLLELSVPDCARPDVSHVEYNILICDKGLRRIERFDPLGDSQTRYNSSQLNIVLSHIANRMKFEYISTNDSPFRESVFVPQVIYSIFYLHMRLLYGLGDDAFRFNRKLLRYLRHDEISGNLVKYFHLYVEQVLQASVYLKKNWRFYHQQRSNEDNMSRFLNGIQENETIQLVNYRQTENSMDQGQSARRNDVQEEKSPDVSIRYEAPGLFKKLLYPRVGISRPNLQDKTVLARLYRQYADSEDAIPELHEQLMYVFDEGPRLIKQLGLSSIAEEWNSVSFWGRRTLKALTKSALDAIDELDMSDAKGRPRLHPMQLKDMTPEDWFHLYPVEIYRLLVAMSRWRDGKPRFVSTREERDIGYLNINLLVMDVETPDNRYVKNALVDDERYANFEEALYSVPMMMEFLRKARKSMYNQTRRLVLVDPESITLTEIYGVYPQLLKVAVMKWEQIRQIRQRLPGQEAGTDPFKAYDQYKKKRDKQGFWRPINDSPLREPDEELVASRTPDVNSAVNSFASSEPVMRGQKAMVLRAKKVRTVRRKRSRSKDGNDGNKRDSEESESDYEGESDGEGDEYESADGRRDARAATVRPKEYHKFKRDARDLKADKDIRNAEKWIEEYSTMTRKNAKAQRVQLLQTLWPKLVGTREKAVSLLSKEPKTKKGEKYNDLVRIVTSLQTYIRQIGDIEASLTKIPDMGMAQM